MHNPNIGSMAIFDSREKLNMTEIRDLSHNMSDLTPTSKKFGMEKKKRYGRKDASEVSTH